MSDSILRFSEDSAPAQQSSEPLSGGAMLREAREAAGLHIAALAVLLKIPVKKLEALEADRFDLLPDMVFVRALASSVCRTLKIAPDPILGRLPHTAAPRLKTDESGINVPFRAPRDGLGLSFWDQLSKPFVLTVLVLLVGALVLVFFPFTPRTEVTSAPKSETAAAIFPAPMSTPLPAENPLPAEAVAPGQTSSSDVSGSAALLTVNSVPMASSASLPDPATSAAAGTAIGSGATTGIVTFTARGPCWVEVIDAGGVVQVRKTMVVGEVVGASGMLPLSVVVGRADATTVQVRGIPFDMTGIAKDNVARFEVK